MILVQGNKSFYKKWGLRGRKTSLTEMDSPLIESLNTSLPKFLLMIVADGTSVTETPRLKRGSMWYASAPFNSPILGHSTLTLVLGVGAILSACGASPSTRSERLWARWGYEAGSSALQGGGSSPFLVLHNGVVPVKGCIT